MRSRESRLFPWRRPGGAWLPLALLCAALSGAGPARAGELEDRSEKAYELTGVERLRLRNVNGAVHVGAWDRAYVRVTAVKKARGSRGEQLLRETEVRVAKSGSVLEIETILPKRGHGFPFFFWGGERGANVAYDLLLPATLAIDIETVNGRITAERRTGPVTLSTVNGSVRVEAQDGPVKVNTVNGSVEVVFAAALKAADLETVNGSVQVSCSRESSIRYELQTVNGKIHSDFAPLNVEGKWGPKEAHGSLNGGRERLAVETVNGEVRLRVADSALAVK